MSQAARAIAPHLYRTADHCRAVTILGHPNLHVAPSTTSERGWVLIDSQRKLGMYTGCHTRVEATKPKSKAAYLERFENIFGE